MNISFAWYFLFGEKYANDAILYNRYAYMPTGLAPDEIMMRDSLRGSVPFQVTKSDYILRPETVETFFILNKLTGDPIYRTWGWEIFEAIERFCKTDIAYGAYSDVSNTDSSPTDSMESFFMGETLKYLYLLFDPDTEVDILNEVRQKIIGILI